MEMIFMISEKNGSKLWTRAKNAEMKGFPFHFWYCKTGFDRQILGVQKAFW